MFSSINWYGAYSLYKRETGRFLNTFHQSIIGPTVAAITLFLVLNISAEGSRRFTLQVSVQEFIVYGLIMQNIIQASFSNTSASLTTSKVIGYIHDILMPPFGSLEILAAYVGSAVTRSIVIGCFLTVFFAQFVSLSCKYPAFVLYFGCISSIVMANVGMITGIIAKDFERTAAANIYVVTPLSFLSCTFYSLSSLPKSLQKFVYYNPFFYMMDGFRYGFTGYSEGSILFGSIFLLILGAVLFFCSALLLRSGYGMKS